MQNAEEENDETLIIQIKVILLMISDVDLQQFDFYIRGLYWLPVYFTGLVGVFCFVD